MIYTLLFSALLMHPLHETVSEVQWNPKSGRLEVAMRLHAMDAQWLEKNRDTHDDEKSKSVDGQWQSRYLRQNFRVDPSSESAGSKAEKAKQPAFHWVGSKQDGAHVWWFFEIEPADRKMPAVIESQMLFEMEKDFVHRVLVLPPDNGKANKPGSPPVALTLTIQHPSAELKPSNHDIPSERRD